MLICRTKTGYSEHIKHMYKQQITVVFVLFNVVEEQDKQKSKSHNMLLIKNEKKQLYQTLVYNVLL